MCIYIYIYIGVWDCEPTYLSRVPFAAGIACHFSLSHWVKSKYDQPKTLGTIRRQTHLDIHPTSQVVNNPYIK